MRENWIKAQVFFRGKCSAGEACLWHEYKMFLKQLVPGYGRADPRVMKELRRLAVKAERQGKFDTPLRKVVSLTFVLRRLPTAFFPVPQDVKAATKLSGKSGVRQIAERLILLLLFRNEPNVYYRIGLFMPERYRRAGEFVDYRQHSFLSFLLNQNKTAILTEDKVRFHDLCVKNSLPCPKIMGVLDPQETDAQMLHAQIEEAAQNRGIFFKPRFGLKAQGAGRIQFDGGSKWLLNVEGDTTVHDCWPEVFEKLTSINQALIFQKQLENHPLLATINPTVLHTIRLVTFRDCEKIHVLEALLRLGKKGSVSDNITAGGIGIPIDFEAQSLGKGTTMNTGDLPRSIESLEPSGNVFAGMYIPFLDEAVDLGKKVHELFPEIFSLGHDIAILPDGPVIMETNHIWGDNQEIFDVGHGAYTRFAGSILEIAKTRNLLQ